MEESLAGETQALKSKGLRPNLPNLPNLFPQRNPSPEIKGIKTVAALEPVSGDGETQALKSKGLRRC